MPWGWILSALLVPTGLLLIAMALFHVRFRASWGGAWESLDSRQGGAFRVEYGFPGFMREWTWEDTEASVGGATASTARPASARNPSAPDVPPRAATAPQDPDDEADIADEAPADLKAKVDETRDAESEAPAPSDTTREPTRARRTPRVERRRALRRRLRRALFRFATDGKAWRLVARHGYHTARGVLTLLRPRVAIAVGHPDPVLLGRVAAAWHAGAPLLAANRATLELRFQDRRPTFAIRAEGGFSALSFILFGIRNVTTFPWIGLGRRAWHGWWRHELEGWRAWLYRRIQE